MSVKCRERVLQLPAVTHLPHLCQVGAPTVGLPPWVGPTRSYGPAALHGPAEEEVDNERLSTAEQNCALYKEMASRANTSCQPNHFSA